MNGMNRTIRSAFVHRASVAALLAVSAGCSGGVRSSSPTIADARLPAAHRTLTETSARQWLSGRSLSRLGSARGLEPDMSAGFVGPDAASKAAIIVSDAGRGDVYAFGVTGKVVATITGLSSPQGLALDSAGNLYVAQTPDVEIFDKNFRKLPLTLGNPELTPSDVAVSRAGYVAVTDLASTTIYLFPSGKPQACATIALRPFNRIYFETFDASGDLYVDGLNSNGSVLIGELPQVNCNSTKVDILSTSNTLDFPGAIQVTPNGDIAVDDQEASAIYTYAPPKNGSLGSPLSTTNLGGAGDPVAFAFSHTADRAWTTDAGLLTVEEYRYPAGGAPIASIKGPLEVPIGIVATKLAP
jgi:hypothetical protein